MFGINYLLNWLCPLMPDDYDYTLLKESIAMPKKITTKLPYETTYEIVVFTSVVQTRRHFYVYAPNVENSFEFHKIMGLEWLTKESFERVYLPDDGDLQYWDNLYLCMSCDCFDPPKYLISAQHESEALECFINETEICRVSEPDLKDYRTGVDGQGNDIFDDQITWDDSGNPNDTSQTRVVKVYPFLCLNPLPENDNNETV